jgi:uncharacterized membrane protein YesL
MDFIKRYWLASSLMGIIVTLTPFILVFAILILIDSSFPIFNGVTLFGFIGLVAYLGYYFGENSNSS